MSLGHSAGRLDVHRAIYEKLKAVAKAEDLISYGEIAPLAGLDMENPDDRNKLAEILGEISTHEHQQKRPLLSAVVILKGNNIPDQGFFTPAKKLGVYIGSDNLKFFILELRKVHEYWRSA